MQSIRVAWEPANKVPIDVLEKRISRYSEGKFSFNIMKNGTLLFFKNNDDLNNKIKKTMELARMLTDFTVDVMEEGDYIVHFKGPLYIYVAKDEFESQKSQIRKRLRELTFPGESFFNAGESVGEQNTLVGIYARAKMYRDAFDIQLVKTVDK